MKTLADRWEATMVPNYGTPQLQLARGRGAHVWDEKGNRYLDLLAGLAVNILGHAHPTVVAAVCNQVSTLGHVSNLYATEPALALAERLSQMTGGKQAVLVNSGSEANETAYKMVRRHGHATDRPEGVVLAFENGFHGRTTAALALTGQSKKHEGFTPLPPGIVHVPYNDPAALEEAFQVHDVIGLFAECVQGEGGVVALTQETADVLSRLTREDDAVLVVDEVQTGLGRTGRTFSYEHFGLEPDIVTLAKALGGGLSAGACLATAELAARMGPGSHGCTFGGNPVACAAANAVLDVYEAERLDERAEALGGRLAGVLDENGLDHRGLGLLVGLPLEEPMAGNIVDAGQKQGLLVGQAGPNVVRLAPPLIIEEDELLDAVPVIAKLVASTNPPTAR